MSLIAGLPETFNELFEEYHDAILGWGLWEFVNPNTKWSAQDVEDAVQDVWTHLCQRKADAPRRDPNGNDWAYLKKCVRNAVFKKRVMTTESLDPELYLPAPPESQFEEMIDGMDNADIVRRIYLNRETQSEIAESLGYKSHASVKRRLDRAMEVARLELGMAT